MTKKILSYWSLSEFETDENGFILNKELAEPIENNVRFCIREVPYKLGTNHLWRPDDQT